MSYNESEIDGKHYVNCRRTTRNSKILSVFSNCRKDIATIEVPIYRTKIILLQEAVNRYNSLSNPSNSTL